MRQNKAQVVTGVRLRATAISQLNPLVIGLTNHVGLSASDGTSCEPVTCVIRVTNRPSSATDHVSKSK